MIREMILNYESRAYEFDSSSAYLMFSNLAFMVDSASAECAVSRDREREMQAIQKMPGGTKRIDEIMRGVIRGASTSVRKSVIEVDAAVCGEIEALLRLLHVETMAGERSAHESVKVQQVLASAASGGRHEVVQEVLWALGAWGEHTDVLAHDGPSSDGMVHKDGAIKAKGNGTTAHGRNASNSSDEANKLPLRNSSWWERNLRTSGSEDERQGTINQPIGCSETGSGGAGVGGLHSLKNRLGRAVDVSKALWRAARGGHSKVVELLIDHGNATVDIVGSGGSTPLWIASSNGNKETVAALLERGADPFALDKINLIAIGCCAREGAHRCDCPSGREGAGGPSCR